MFVLSKSIALHWVCRCCICCSAWRMQTRGVCCQCSAAPSVLARRDFGVLCTLIKASQALWCGNNLHDARPSQVHSLHKPHCIFCSNYTSADITGELQLAVVALQRLARNCSNHQGRPGPQVPPAPHRHQPARQRRHQLPPRNLPALLLCSFCCRPLVAGAGDHVGAGSCGAAAAGVGCSSIWGQLFRRTGCGKHIVSTAAQVR